jgi:asparagine synthase (glutamine-hydrolysing)
LSRRRTSGDAGEVMACRAPRGVRDAGSSRMCGICGLVSERRLTGEDQGRVRVVCAAMFHRGPDGAGEMVTPQAMLAMRRLSIIDLSGGWQPLYNEDKTVAVVANGEVYNYVELRRDLEERGHVFTTGSDCETIVHAYEEWGLEFVHKLRGMYAIAVHDANRKRVVLVRDRMGEKPLYLYEQPGRVLFASEMKSILASGLIKFEMDPAAVYDYMHFNYVPDPATAVVGVTKLPAGHLMVIDLEPWRTERRRYWRLEDAPALTGDPAEHIRERLEEIGKLIIRSDVPVGVALSAGLDSGMVAALAAKHAPGKIRALSIGYKGRPHNDERAGAKRLAEHLGMPFLEYEVGVDEVVDLFADRNFMRDDPIADISGHGYYALSRLARANGIPVLLQGHGIDELFWGYSWVRQAMMSSMKKCGRMPKRWTDRLGFLKRLVPANMRREGIRDWVFYWSGFVNGWRSLRPTSGMGDDVLDFYNMANEFQMGRYAARRILTEEFQSRMTGRHAEDWFTVPRPWGDVGVAITSAVCGMYLLENGMQQGDRLSMAWAVELRLPFVDYRLAETAVGLRKISPDHMMVPKARFRSVIREYLPEWVLARPKSGFSPPMLDWVGTLNHRYNSELRRGYLVEHGILEPSAAARLSMRGAGLSAGPSTVYKALVLEWWARGMSEASRFKPSEELMRAPRPALTSLLPAARRTAGAVVAV